jgi:hypothetical protein
MRVALLTASLVGAAVQEQAIQPRAEPIRVTEGGQVAPCSDQGILGGVDCAPRTGKEGSINYVLEVDFESNRYTLFPGKSGKWRGPQARRATQCVLRAFPPVDLAGLSHQYAYYAIAIMAVYPAPDPFDVLPTFE